MAFVARWQVGFGAGGIVFPLCPSSLIVLFGGSFCESNAIDFGCFGSFFLPLIIIFVSFLIFVSVGIWVKTNWVNL